MNSIYRKRKRDYSTLDKRYYILEHLCFSGIFGYAIYNLLHIVAPIAYYERSITKIAMSLLAAETIGIILTYSNRRNHIEMIIDIVLGMALYIIWILGDYIKITVLIIGTVVAIVSLVEITLMFFRRINHGYCVKKLIMARIYKSCLLLRRNLGIAAVAMMVCLPISMSMLSVEQIVQILYKRHDSSAIYQESKCEVREIYGDEYALCENIDKLRMIRDNEIWKTLDLQEKMNVVEVCCHMQARYLGCIHKLNIVFTDMGTTTGAYEDETKTVYIDINGLNRSNEEVYQTVSHEIRHAWQYSVYEVYTKLSPEERNLFSSFGVENWIDNMEHYISENEDALLYLIQPVEMDARVFAKEDWQEFMKEVDSISVGE